MLTPEQFERVSNLACKQELTELEYIELSSLVALMKEEMQDVDPTSAMFLASVLR